MTIELTATTACLRRGRGRSIVVVCMIGWSAGVGAACGQAGDPELPRPDIVDELPGQPGAGDITFTAHVQVMPVRVAPVLLTQGPAPAARLRNNGGKMIEAPKVVQVLYGAGTYLPQLTNAPAPNMASAYREMVTTSVFGWLYEYNTESPAQRIGRGQFLQSRPIDPADSRNRTLITDADVQSELAAQIEHNTLPAPNADTIYMVHFPRQKINMAPT